MAVIVDADTPSVRAVEAFLAETLGRHAEVGKVRFVCGLPGALVAGCARASAVTLGRWVFLSRAAAARVEAVCDGGRMPVGGAVRALGSLFVHECVHVAQYRRAGSARFLVIYLFFYFNRLTQLKSLGAAARLAAYRAIPLEEEAFRCEEAWARAASTCRHDARRAGEPF